jgi:hypothetical protein
MVLGKGLKLTDEKKPPDTVAAAPQTGAQIVLGIAATGVVHMQASCWGTLDSSYVVMSDERLLGQVLPTVLAELRSQLTLGRRLTPAESAAIAAGVHQFLSVSTATV